MSSTSIDSFSSFGEVKYTIEDKQLFCYPSPIETNKDCNFTTEWNLFVKVCGLDDDHNDTSSRTADILCLFKEVMNRKYKNSKEYNHALFIALYNALDNGQNKLKIVGTSPETQAFVLQGTNVGFVRQIPRRYVGLAMNYVSSEDEDFDSAHDIIFDQACVVFTNNKEFTNNKVTVDNIQDVTSIVDIKVGDRVCGKFTIHSDGVHESPDYDRRHHKTLGRAVLNALDVWTCLARRGQPTDKVPVVVLGGYKVSTTIADLKDKVRCVHSWLHIPSKLTEAFHYTITKIVPYHSINSDEMAIATYIRSLRIGIEHALAIDKSNDRPPISLCCKYPSVGGIELPDAELVASPIVGAVKIRQDLSITQGEFFSWTPSSALQFNQSARTNMYSFCDQPWEGPLLVKVCSLSIHRSLVPMTTNTLAMMHLHISDDKLKNELATVLLACIEESSSTVVTVMRDLATPDESNNGMSDDSTNHNNKPQRTTSHTGFKDLSPVMFENRLYKLWVAFRKLVIDLLLPMARIGVLHYDIRAGWEKTFNILYRELDNDGNIELRLIDYESLGPLRTSVPVDGRTMNSSFFHAISCELTAYKFLWWQILLVAYVWITKDKNEGRTWGDSLAWRLVRGLFTKKEKFEAFQNYLGDQWAELFAQEANNNFGDEQCVMTLLDLISVAILRAEDN